MAPRELPSHLRSYALQRRNAACFSGPGVLPGEQEVGHIEYKLRLLDPTPSRFQQLVTQLNWRLSEGCGECIYFLGVEDNGHPLGLAKAELSASLAVLRAMAVEVRATAEVLQTPPGSAKGRRCAVVRVVRSTTPALHFVDLRVAVAGGVDSGKSTLVGVLSHGAGGAPLLDNGRGSARMRVFRHKHECESGHTSSISLQQLAYDAAGNVLNYSGLSNLDPAEVAASAARMLRFFDLGGHERFSKTMLHGLTCMLPDYLMLCVSAVAGVSWVTREHLAVGIALGIPLFITITKADLASDAAVQAVAAEIRGLLAAAVQQGGGTVNEPADLAPLVGLEAQAVQLAGAMHRSRIAAPGASLCVPLFPTSSVTGTSLQLLHSFLNALQPTTSAAEGAADWAAGAPASLDGLQGWRQAGAAAEVAGEVDSCAAGASGTQQPLAHFQIDASFDVVDVGPVYSGTVVSGSISLGDQLLLGPLEGGSFCRVAVSGIHRSKVDVQSVQQGQHATLAVHPVQEAGAAVPGADGSGITAADSVADGRQQQTASLPALPGSFPLRADSAGCLQAWMQQSSSADAAGGAACSAGPAMTASRQGRLPPSTPALAIQGQAGASHGSAGLPDSQLAHRLARSQHPLAAAGSGDLNRLCGSLPQLLSASSGPAPRPRKGAVLLDPSLQPHASTQFEAVLVLLGGQWPARGLLSGRYPPDEGQADAPEPCLVPAGGSSYDLATGGNSTEGLAGSSLGAQRPNSLGSGKLHSRRRPAAYIPVVHCGSIRQAAQVVAMQELSLPRSGLAVSCGGGGGASLVEGCSAGSGEEGEAEDLFSALDLMTEPSGGSSIGGAAGGAASELAVGHALQPDLCKLAGALAAAGMLLPQPWPGSGPGCSSSGEGAGTQRAAGGSPGGQLAAALERQRSLFPSEDIGCVAAVTFTFMHQPEWLVEGARLIVRDRTTSRTAAAGYVMAVHPPARQDAS